MINSASLSSKVVANFFDYKVISYQPNADTNIEDDNDIRYIQESNLRKLEKCLIVKVAYPDQIWPHFASMKLTLDTSEKLECAKLAVSNVELRVTFILHN
jgi:hypothetical protein